MQQWHKKRKEMHMKYTKQLLLVSAVLVSSLWAPQAEQKVSKSVAGKALQQFGKFSKSDLSRGF